MINRYNINSSESISILYSVIILPLTVTLIEICQSHHIRSTTVQHYDITV